MGIYGTFAGAEPVIEKVNPMNQLVNRTAALAAMQSAVSDVSSVVLFDLLKKRRNSRKLCSAHCCEILQPLGVSYLLHLEIRK